LNLNQFRILSAQPSISQKLILEIDVPLPAKEKQNEIVEKIDALKNEIKELKNQAEANRAKAKENFEKEIFGEG